MSFGGKAREEARDAIFAHGAPNSTASRTSSPSLTAGTGARTAEETKDLEPLEVLRQLPSVSSQNMMINLLFQLGTKAAKHRRDALGPFFASPEELIATEKAFAKGGSSSLEYMRSVAAAVDKLNLAEYTRLTTVPADEKCMIFGSALPTARLHFGPTILRVEAPDDEHFDNEAFRYEKSVAMFELKPQVDEQQDGNWIVTVTIKKEKVETLRRAGVKPTRSIICRADVSAAMTRDRPRARTVRHACFPAGRRPLPLDCASASSPTCRPKSR